MSHYTFTVSPATLSNKNLSELNTKISQKINVPINTVNSNGNSKVNVDFNDELSNSERIKLHKVLLSWDTESTNIYEKIIPVYLNGNGINTSSYLRYGVYGYSGTNLTLSFKKISIVAYMDNTVTDYSVRIFNMTNSNIIAEATFTNTTEQILDMGSLSNIPSNPSILEIHLKRNGGNNNSKAYATQVIFYS